MSSVVALGIVFGSLISPDRCFVTLENRFQGLFDHDQIPAFEHQPCPSQFSCTRSVLLPSPGTGKKAVPFPSPGTGKKAVPFVPQWDRSEIGFQLLDGSIHEFPIAFWTLFLSHLALDFLGQEQGEGCCRFRVSTETLDGRQASDREVLSLD